MLKWLVQKTPDSASLEDVITDDPLATLDLEKIVRRKKAKEIYSVNRTNPLYSEHDYKFLVHHGTAKSSSSGYASRSPNRTTKNTAKGFQTDFEIQAYRVDFHNALQNPPPPVWPNHYNKTKDYQPKYTKNKELVSSGQVPLVIKQKNNKFVSNIDMFKGKPNESPTTLDVVKNDRFVSAIKFGRVPIIGGGAEKRDHHHHHNTHDQDSIVTDSLLQMTSFNSKFESGTNFEREDEDSLRISSRRKKEDMDKVIEELTQAMIRSRPKAMSKTYSTATSSGSGNSQFSGRRFRNSLRKLKKNGLNTMKDLWEKSGKKTNGRKLLVDSFSEDGSGKSSHSSQLFKRQRRVRRRSSKVPKKNFPRKKSSVGSTSSSSASCSEVIYASVFEDDIDIDDGSEFSGSSHNSNKRVTFRPDVVDNEKVITARKKSSVVIDVDKLAFNNHHWESYYGSSGRFAGDPSKHRSPIHVSNNNHNNNKTDYGSAVFESPYFDYRRTHSRAGSNASIASHPIPRVKPEGNTANQAKNNGKRSAKGVRLCAYWKSFLTVSLFGVVLIVLVLMSLFIMDRKQIS